MKKGTPLILIDIQKGFDDLYWGPRNNPEMESKVERLLALWRSRSEPVIHVQHLSTHLVSPLHPSKAGVSFSDFALPLPGERVFQKHVNSAFIGTGLQDFLMDQDFKKIVLAGFTSDHCVSTSARMGANLGFEVTIVGDATATFDRHGPDGTLYRAELVHSVSLASLNQEFAQIVMLEDLKVGIAQKAQ